MFRYIYIPIGTFAFVTLFCVIGTLRDTGGQTPDAGTLVADVGFAYAVAALLAVAMFLIDCSPDTKPSR